MPVGACGSVGRCLPPQPALLPLLLVLQAQLGQLVALGTAASAAGTSGDVPLPCIHMGTSQLLPRLTLAGPVATTASCASGTFHLAATTAPTDAAHFPAGLASALRCRCHGKHVGLAVSVLCGRRGSCSASEHDSDGGDGVSEALPLSPACQLAQEQGMSVLEAWAPDAASAEGWGLYEFEISSGGWMANRACLDCRGGYSWKRLGEGELHFVLLACMYWFLICASVHPPHPASHSVYRRLPAQ